MKARRVDDNQASIVAALRKAGCSVQVLSSVGNGVPDILVGMVGSNYLMEIKDGSKSPSRRKLTPDEEAWHAAWRGSVVVVESVPQALAVVGVKV